MPGIEHKLLYWKAEVVTEVIVGSRSTRQDNDTSSDDDNKLPPINRFEANDHENERLALCPWEE